MQGVSIIIPTRNEADNIDLLLQRIFAIDYLQDVEHEIIFVDDSSTDATRDNIRSWTKDRPVRLIERDSGGGLASAVVAGAHQAAFPVALVMDADLSHPPEKIPELVDPLLADGYDMVIGSRYVEGGATPEWPLSRKIASKLATIPARLFTDVNDPMAGFFATSTARLKSLRPDVPGFKILLEVLAVGGEQLRTLEVPIVFNDRFEGFSKMNKGIMLAYLKQVSQLSRLQENLITLSAILAFISTGSILDILVFWVALHYGVQPVYAHISGMTAGAVFLFVVLALLWRKWDENNRVTVRLLAGFVLPLIFSISIQGGIYYLLTRTGMMSRILAFAPGAVAGTACFTLLCIVYLFSGFRRLPRNVQSKLAVIGGVTALILLRLVYLGLPELMEQEAYYWNYAQHPDLSYLDHPPMVAVLIWLGTAVFGTTEFGVRIGAFLTWFVTAFFAYRLTTDIFNRTAAWGAVLLLSILPLYFGTGFVVTPDATLHAAWAAFIYFLYCALIKGSSRAWLGVGISLGIGMLSKYTIALLGPGILCFLLLDRRARSWILRSEPYGALLIALIIFAPVLIWNYQHDWVSFLFQGEQRVSGKEFFTTHRLLGYMTLLLTPAGLLGMLYFFGGGNSFFKAATGPNKKVGLIDRRYLFLFFLILSPLAVFFIFSLTREVKLNWTSPVWLAAMPFLGSTVSTIHERVKSLYLRFVEWLWKITGVVLVLGYCALLHYATLGLPGVPYNFGLFLMGWEDLATEIEALVDKVEEHYGDRPVVVGMDPYQISSGLAFYRSKINRGDERRQQLAVKETLGWHLFGWKALMYEYWAKPEDYYGRDVIAVAGSRIRVEYPYFQNRFMLMNNIHPLDISKNGESAGRYYVRVVRKYRAAPN